jgi:hypothetical protein
MLEETSSRSSVGESSPVVAGEKKTAVARPRWPLPPAILTDNAREVLVARYLRRLPDGSLEETPEELFWRVARTIAEAERNYTPQMGEEVLEEVALSFYRLMVSGQFMPNSPTLMNAGRGTGMLSACFVLPVEDSIDGIFDSVKATALIQKAGGGTGFAFDALRPTGDYISSSGGTTRRPGLDGACGSVSRVPSPLGLGMARNPGEPLGPPIVLLLVLVPRPRFSWRARRRVENEDDGRGRGRLDQNAGLARTGGHARFRVRLASRGRDR